MNSKLIILIIGGLFIISCSTVNKGIDKGRTVNKIESQWSNLKVLPQDISEDDLKNVMRSFNEGLGVKCNHCHTPNPETGKIDFASDAKKEKEYARYMYTMTKELNKNHFDYDPSDKQKVTCFTCHQGNVKPKKVTDMVVKETIKVTEVAK